jgi:hypothetical protein
MIWTGPHTPVPKGLTFELTFEQLPRGPLAPVFLAHAPLTQNSLSLPAVHALIVPSARPVAPGVAEQERRRLRTPGRG